MGGRLAGDARQNFAPRITFRRWSPAKFHPAPERSGPAGSHSRCEGPNASSVRRFLSSKNTDEPERGTRPPPTFDSPRANAELRESHLPAARVPRSPPASSTFRQCESCVRDVVEKRRRATALLAIRPRGWWSPCRRREAKFRSPHHLPPLVTSEISPRTGKIRSRGQPYPTPTGYPANPHPPRVTTPAARIPARVLFWGPLVEKHRRAARVRNSPTPNVRLAQRERRTRASPTFASCEFCVRVSSSESERGATGAGWRGGCGRGGRVRWTGRGGCGGGGCGRRR